MARASANNLLVLSKGNARACAVINDRLKEVSLPLADVMTHMEDRKSKLDRVDELLRKYEKEKGPFEELITEASVAVDALEPFGLDEEEGKKQVEKLNVSEVLFVILFGERILLGTSQKITLNHLTELTQLKTFTFNQFNNRCAPNYSNLCKLCDNNLTDSF